MRRYAEGNSDRLRELAADLIAGNVYVVVALSTTAALAAKQQAKETIPIVAIGMADPVADELVVSLGRPGCNVTGTSFVGPELVAKRLQLLREMVPGLSRVDTRPSIGHPAQRPTPETTDEGPNDWERQVDWHLMNGPRQNTQRELAQAPTGRGEAPTIGVPWVVPVVAMATTENPAATMQLIEEVRERANLVRAWQRVRENKGAPDVYGMTIDDAKSFLREHWPDIRIAGRDLPAATGQTRRNTQTG
jgi:hypothetical protein